MPNPSLHLRQIGQIAVNAKDIDRATRFYRDVLGMRHLFTAGTLSFFDLDGVRLMLSLPEKPEFDHPASLLYYRVDDIAAACKALSGHVDLTHPPEVVHRTPEMELWIAAFPDTEGNTVALMSEVPVAR